MTTRAGEIEAPAIALPKRLIGGRTFNQIFMTACIWLLVGGYLDAWAHNNIPRLETFFTPWHGVLYSGFLAVALTLSGAILINHSRGYSWREAVPPGYELSLVAAAGFAAFGVGDMCWHIFFGIERNIDAALSPTHLGLATCMGLLLAGPYRSLYRKSPQLDAAKNWRAQFVLPFAALLVLLPFTLITQMANPFNTFWPTFATTANDNMQILAIISVVFQTTILMGLLLISMRRWHLPMGFFTIVYTINALFLSFMLGHYPILLMVLPAGVITDIVYRWLKPSQTQVAELRIFAFLAPIILYSFYFLVLDVVYGIVWTIHLAGGSIVVAGITGWLLSYVLFMTKPATEEQERV
jgi:hypothetical protein